MKVIVCLLTAVAVLPVLMHSQGHTDEVRINKDISVKIVRLSKRVLVLTDVPPNGNVTAISTEKGLIIIDTGVSWSFGGGFRRIIEHEFKRNDFAYVINTHADRDHTFGNQAFNDDVIIAHDNCKKALQNLKMQWDIKKDEYISVHKDRAERNFQDLEEGAFDSTEAIKKHRLIATNRLIAADLSESQEITPPSVTFADRMTLHSGDLILDLYY